MEISIVVVLVLAVLSDVSTAETKNGEWSPCSKSCGRGTRTITYCYWREICSKIYQGCNIHPCPVIAWGEWQPCSKTCGGGTRYKVNKCPENNTDECPKTYEDCNTQSCPTTLCPIGSEFRYNDTSSCCKSTKEQIRSLERAGGKFHRPSVVGGLESEESQWPWAAVIVSKSSNLTHCTGSLVHNRWVLTAAHCIEDSSTGNDYPKNSLYILLGTTTIKSPSINHQRYEIDLMIKHHSYDYPQHDVGLIKLSGHVPYTGHVRPVSLPGEEIAPHGTTCYFTGWGTTQWQSDEPSDKLMEVALRVLPFDICVQGFKNINSTIWLSMEKEQHLCAGILSGGKDSCAADSGGPLVCQRCSSCEWFLAGTTSFGATECGAAGVPAVYMNMLAYETWIRQTTGLVGAISHTC